MKRFLSFVAVFLIVAPAYGSQRAADAPVQIQVVDERGVPVRNAVIEVTPSAGVRSPQRFGWRAAMAQRDLQFTPGTLVVARGQSVAFPNLDRVRHSIYSFSKPARFEIDLYGRDQTRSHRFPITGSVALGCNIHDDMRGYIRVVETPFAGKTNYNGMIRFDSVPQGNAKVTIWHPRLRAPGNEKTSSITIRSAVNEKYEVTLR